MENNSRCLKGTNWFQHQINDNYFIAQYNEKELFKIPIKKITNSTVVNKNDIMLDLNNDDLKDSDDILCEMRLFVQPVNNEEENNEDEEPGQNLAENLNKEILNKANIVESVDKSIITFNDVPLVIPRGKYTVDFYQNYIRLHGATFNMRVDFKNIERAFLLPQPDDVHFIFVIALEKPIRQGNTAYPFLVVKFHKDVQNEIQLNKNYEQLKEVYGENLKKEYQGPQYDIFTKIFKTIVQKNIIVPGGTYKSATGKQGVKCHVKAQEGLFFPLQKSIIFVNKPVLYIKFEDIVQAEFQRVGSAFNQSKLFDIEIKRKDKQPSQIFVGIDKSELQNLKQYFESRKVKTVLVDESKLADQFLGEGDDDDVEIETEDEDAQGKRVRKPVSKERKQQIMNELEDDEDDDESFNENDIGDASDSDQSQDIDTEEEEEEKLKKKK